jgi:ribosomal protein S18 acetylase RimI-like enzyme
MSERDWELLRNLRLRMLREDAHAFGSSYEREAGFDEARWRRRAAGTDGVPVQGFIAELPHGADEGQAVGMAAGVVEPPNADAEAGNEGPNVAMLVSMWVAPERRGRGVGERLTGAVRDWADAAGFAELRLIVHNDNGPARRLYERFGFRAVSIGGGESGRDITMTLPLRTTGPGRAQT